MLTQMPGYCSCECNIPVDSPFGRPHAIENEVFLGHSVLYLQYMPTCVCMCVCVCTCVCMCVCTCVCVCACVCVCVSVCVFCVCKGFWIAQR